MLVQGWSGAKLARRTGVSPSTFSRVTYGQRVQPARLNRIAGAVSESWVTEPADERFTEAVRRLCAESMSTLRSSSQRPLIFDHDVT